MKEPKEFSVEIDPYQLDKEWVAQPGFYHKHALQLADARRDQDAWKAELELVRAELYAEVVADPAKFGLQKTTEESVKNCILTQRRYQETQTKLLECRHAVDIWEAAVAAIDQRKRALESLVQLQLSDYYARPSAPSAAAAKVEERKRNAVLERSQYGIQG